MARYSAQYYVSGRPQSAGFHDAEQAKQWLASAERNGDLASIAVVDNETGSIVAKPADILGE